MKITEQWIRERLASYEEKVRAYRIMLQDVAGEQQESKRQQSGTILAQAIALDSERRNGGTAPKKRMGRPPTKDGSVKGKRGYGKKESVKERRQRTAEFLKGFSRTQTKSGGAWEGLGPLVRRGYLERIGKGMYRLTDKEYVV